jgi:hypothetical protein
MKAKRTPSPMEILQKYQHYLDERETDFLKSLCEWKGKLTPRQSVAVKDIFESVQGRTGPRLVR